jgi:hypothetical protein
MRGKKGEEGGSAQQFERKGVDAMNNFVTNYKAIIQIAIM